MADAVPATFIETGDAVGGHITSLGHEPHNYTIFYVKVDDVKTYLEKATALGGKTLVGHWQFQPAPSPGSPIPRATPSGYFKRISKARGITDHSGQSNAAVLLRI
jgi:hypothetical protein